MGKQVQLVADDFGLNRAVNEAVIKAHREGALTGASLMMGQAGTAEAVGLAREHPQLAIGWHLHLNDSTPTTGGTCWPWGAGPGDVGWRAGFSGSVRRRIRDEMRHQWGLFIDTGLPCAFANVHHHLQAHPFVFREWVRVLMDGPTTFAGWLRLGFPCRFRPGALHAVLGGLLRCERRRRMIRCPFPVSDTLWGLDRLFCMDPVEVTRVTAGLPAGIHEFIFHPRSTEEELDADLRCLIRLKNNRDTTVHDPREATKPVA